MVKYPTEFLGRCGVCLDNAYLSFDPCPTGHGNGQPLFDSDCPIFCARKAYDQKRSAVTPDKGTVR